MKTMILALTSEPVEMLNNILSYVQLLLPVRVGLNLHPLALCSHLRSAMRQEENELCHFASWMAFKFGSGKCLLECVLWSPINRARLCLAAVASGTTALSRSAGAVVIFDCRLLMELLSRCDCLRLVFHADVLGFKPSARSQTTNVWEEGRTCCASAVIVCRRCRFKFWLCYRFPMWPCTNIPVHQLP